MHMNAEAPQRRERLQGLMPGVQTVLGHFEKKYLQTFFAKYPNLFGESCMFRWVDGRHRKGFERGNFCWRGIAAANLGLKKWRNHRIEEEEEKEVRGFFAHSPPPTRDRADPFILPPSRIWPPSRSIRRASSLLIYDVVSPGFSRRVVL